MSKTDTKELTITLRQVKCLRCGNVWTPMVEHPKQCPACRNSYWDKPRVKDAGGDGK